MSATTNQPSSSTKPYIGSRRNRDYFSNILKPSLFSNNYAVSTTSPSESFTPIQFEQANNISDAKIGDDLQAEQEQRLPVNHFSSTIPLDERQPYLQEDQKANGVFPSSSSPSLFLFPTAHTITPLSVYNHSPSSFIEEQQHFYQPSREYEQQSYWQPLNNEKENKQPATLEKSEQENDEQQKQKQSFENSISNHYQTFDLSDVPEENSSFTSTCTLTDTTAENNNNDSQTHLFTSTPIIPSTASYSSVIANKSFDTSLPDNNNINKQSTSTEASVEDHSTTVPTYDLRSAPHQITDVHQLDNMSSLRYSSNLGTGQLTAHKYDHQITDEGNKYIIQLKTDEYQQEEFTITPRYSFNQLVIDAKHREEDSLGGYIHRELHKIFNIPTHIDLNRYEYSYNTHLQELTIEMPYIQAMSTANENKNDSSVKSPINNTTEAPTHPYANFNRSTVESVLPMNSNRFNYHSDRNNISGIGTSANESTLFRTSNTAAAPAYESSIGSIKPFDFDLFHRSAFRPQIVRTTASDNNNDKKLIMSLDLSDYQVEDIKVSVKDRELIVKAERKIETDTRKSRTSFFQSTSLPPQTDIENLRSHYMEGKLVIEAPYHDLNGTDRNMITTSSATNNQGHNWPGLTEFQSMLFTNDPYEQRTETIIDIVRRRRC